jgi:lipopolysaccharide/colanic/teichoic acid biosynthesis glycosyltransferase
VGCKRIKLHLCLIKVKRPSSLKQNRIKKTGVERSRDVVGACVLLLFTLPLMLVVALAIKLDSAGPVLEKRELVGRSGRRFRMLSFRIQVQRAGQLSQQMTGAGWIIHHIRIEGLPQLINVLRGEMSLGDMSLFD